jgi:hypothetical protein
MAHFAKVENGIVTQVLVIEQDAINTGHWGDPASWIQTSYNTHCGVHIDPETGEPSVDQSKALRKNYAGIGYIYDSVRDAFYQPKPYPSSVLNEATCTWEAPIPMPIEEGKYFGWNEETLSWIEVIPPWVES